MVFATAKAPFLRSDAGASSACLDDLTRHSPDHDAAQSQTRSDVPRGDAPVERKAWEPPARATPAREAGRDEPREPEREKTAEKAADKPDPNDARRAKARPFVRIGIVIVVLALIAGGVWYWFSTRDLEGTDDAYTDGRAVMVAPQVAGVVVALNVTDNQFVHKGDPIVQIDPRQYRFARDQAAAALVEAQGQLAGQRYGAEIARKNFPAQLDSAKAKLAVAQANLVNAQQNATRQRSLSRGATTQQEVDAANAALNTAQAQVADAQAQVDQARPVDQRIGQTDAQVQQQAGTIMSAQAKLDQADLNLAWTTVTAPQDGWITKRNVEIGNYIAAGQQITSLVSPEVWVTANFKENQLNRMRDGQKVRIEVDAYPSLKLEGHVDSVQLGSGTRFTAFPPENATGNFVKIIQRLPVKIIIDSGLPQGFRLPLGLSVSPTVSLK